MYNPLNFSKIGFEVGDAYNYIAGTQNILNVFIPKNRVRNQKLEVNFLLSTLHSVTFIYYSLLKVQPFQNIVDVLYYGIC